ncbi:DUF2927 domain-containing protein [Meridianimarinicoccus sp. MJW13]|uniref:DUF2927 domain-containing protein n=1 Tax=Meridianimarinicoccus sp. MJW13 TaxID=2720031 RepID=UPI00186940B4|nr:DUF2927 domain-containing protein [Fluviibacterium sp. MJW13]
MGRPAVLSRMAAALAAMLLVTACEMPLSPDTAPRAVPRGDPAPQVEVSEESRELAARYARIEEDLVTRGLLRTDGGGLDTPFDADLLARNFMQIALFDEYAPLSGRLVARETESPLRRWQDPVRVGLVYGASVSAAQRAVDDDTVKALTGRLRAASGHDIRTTSGPGNLTVYVVNEDERRALEPMLRENMPGISDGVMRAITQMPTSTFCLIIAFSADNAPNIYRRAIGIVRAEHPPLLRQSCLHEEITQGLGLANDSPDVRPSIFNDDEEFALLTTQDALMLTILYDPRLRPGMTAPEAAPIVRTIAAELLPEPPPDAEAEDIPTLATAPEADAEIPPLQGET